MLRLSMWHLEFSEIENLSNIIICRLIIEFTYEPTDVWSIVELL